MTQTLAPASWDEYIGQDKVKSLLQTKINSAWSRLEQLDHVLIVGQSGSGKSSLANLIAEEAHQEFLSLMITPNFKMNALNKRVYEFSEEGGGIIFMDELHNLNASSQHYMFSILEGGYLSYDNGEKMFFPHPVTIVGATTEEHRLIKPLLRRFGPPYRLAKYSDAEMALIVQRMARKVDLDPDLELCEAYGRASAGSPNQAKYLVLAARDLNTLELDKVLKATEITEDGLTVDHIDYLQALKKLGMKAGLSNLSSITGRAKEVILDIEKLLIDREYIQMTGSGRVLMQTGLNVLLKLNKEKK